MSSRNAHRIVAVFACCVVVLMVVGAGAAQAQGGKRDRNHDGIPDKWEKRYRLSIRKNQANRDQDRDGVRNKCEFQAKTNPRRDDSDRDGTDDADEDRDRDGVSNGDESKRRANCGKRDTDEDGIDDGDEIFGEIVSFENGVLAILTPWGDLVSAPVAEEVDIFCMGSGEDLEDDPLGEGSTAANYDEGPPPDDTDFELECTEDDLVPGATVMRAFIEDGEFYEVRLIP